MNSEPSSIFRLTRYDFNPKKLRYPCFKLKKTIEKYFLLLEDAENEIKGYTISRFGIYAFVISELPLGIEVGYSASNTLSERVYLPDGTLWGTREYCNFIPGPFFSPEEYNYWGHLCRFYGREQDEIWFKPGDIVEIFGFSGNTYWTDCEVNLGIVVKCPPTREEVSAYLKEYLSSHSGFDVCEHRLSGIYGELQDVYEVLSDDTDYIDRTPTIGVFSPIREISKHSEKRLRSIYEKFLQNQSVSDNR